MKTKVIQLVILLSFLGCKALQAEVDPLEAFSGLILPVMKSFETARISTTLRGCIIRADTFPGIKEVLPTINGLSINVAISDAGSNAKLVDRVEAYPNGEERVVQLPHAGHNDEAVEVEIYIGRDVSSKIRLQLLDVVKSMVDTAAKRKE